MRHGPARELRIAAPIGAQLRCSRFSASTAAASQPFPRGDDDGKALRCCALAPTGGALPPGLGVPWRAVSIGPRLVMVGGVVVVESESMVLPRRARRRGGGSPNPSALFELSSQIDVDNVHTMARQAEVYHELSARDTVHSPGLHLILYICVGPGHTIVGLFHRVRYVFVVTTLSTQCSLPTRPRARPGRGTPERARRKGA